LHYDGSALPKPKAKENQTVKVKLAKGDTAVMAGSTKRVYHGPCSVVYIVYPDGGRDSRRVDD
jgi:alkylated DNA repair dioxygenase AlkB